MNRLHAAMSAAFLFLSASGFAADPAPSATTGLATAVPPVTLPTLEASIAPANSDPAYWPWAQRVTEQVFQLIEGNTLTTGDEFYRASKFAIAGDPRFRADRVRYELLLAAAALGHPEAERGLAGAWDGLLGSLGRPLRTDFGGLVQKASEFYSLASAPASVLAVLRDPAAARATAKSMERNMEMKTIVDADQADRRNWSKLSPEDMKATGERDTARNQRTREIIAAGELHTAADFAAAALVMQHSAVFTGYQTAHELAVCSMLLGDRGTGRWLIAATYDRMLGSIGHEQRFGTQYHGFGDKPALGRFDPTGICDCERKALGCPTLEEARNRNLNASASREPSKLVAEFSAPNQSVRDPQFGFTATYPKEWKLRDVLRWGDQQNTIFFEIANDPEPSPNLYYRVYREARPITAETLPAMLREEARKKEVSRRENLSDYTNRVDGFKMLTIGGYSGCSWLADFTAPDGTKWVEYFVRIQTDVADASFFLQAPAKQIESLRPVVDRLMASVKMPLPGNAPAK